MAQGPRRGWVRAAFTGLGALLCAGAIGCTGLDKPVPPKIGANTGTGANGKQIGPGLPGTPMLPGSPGMGASRTPQPGFGNPAAGVGGSGVMQTGGTNYPATGTPTGGGFNSPAGRQPAGGYNPNVGGGTGAGYPPVGGSSLVPSAGPIGGSGGFGGSPQGYNNTGAFNPPADLSLQPIPPNPPGGDRYNVGTPGGPILPPQSPTQPYTGGSGFGGN